MRLRSCAGIAAEEQRRFALQALFQSMLQQLVTGQVRVPESMEVLPQEKLMGAVGSIRSIEWVLIKTSPFCS